MPTFVKPPVNPSPGIVGPVQLTTDDRETDRQRVKLPPLPKAPGNGSAIQITAGPAVNDSNANGGENLPGRPK